MKEGSIFFPLVFQDRVGLSVCSHGCPETHSVEQAGLRNPPALFLERWCVLLLCLAGTEVFF